MMRSTTPDPVQVRQALDAAATFYTDHLAGSWAHTEATRRGIDITTAGVRLGYAPSGWTTTSDHLLSQGFTPETLLAAGITTLSSRGTPIDTIRDRLTVAINDHDGPIGFTARKHHSADGPKWLNTPTTDLFRKSDHLLVDTRGHNPRPSAMPILCEGAMDVAALHAATVRINAYAAAPCGTALTTAHITHLYAAHPTAPIAVAFDADPAGQTAMVKAWDLLTRHEAFGQRQLLAVELPVDTDPSDLVTAGRADDLRRRIVRARPLAEAVADVRLDGITAHDNALRATVAAKTVIERDWDHVHPHSRGRYARHLAARLDLPHTDITALAAEHITRASELTDAVAFSPLSPSTPARPPTDPPRRTTTPAPPTSRRTR